MNEREWRCGWSLSSDSDRNDLNAILMYKIIKKNPNILQKEIMHWAS